VTTSAEVTRQLAKIR